MDGFVGHAKDLAFTLKETGTPGMTFSDSRAPLLLLCWEGRGGQGWRQRVQFGGCVHPAEERRSWLRPGC